MAEAVPAVMQRVRTFLYVHRIRIGGWLVLAACVAIVLNAAPNNQAGWLILLLPVAAATLLPIASQPSISDSLNGWGSAFDRRRAAARGRDGKFARYFSQPLFGGSVRISEWSESSVADSHLRAGTRLGAILYLWAVMIVA